MATRYFFVHCQKTAGTSLTLQIRKLFDSKEVYPGQTEDDKVNAVLTLDMLRNGLKRNGEDLRYIAGHFPFCSKDLMGQNVKTFTVLRNPVERTLSYLRHRKKISQNDKNKTFEKICDDPFRFQHMIRNHMVKMFALTLDQAKDGMLTDIELGDEHLKLAVKNLRTVDVIGTVDNYNRFCDKLQIKFGWKFEEILHYNRTKADHPVSPALIKRIRRDNLLDIRFYKKALTIIERRKLRQNRYDQT